MRVHIIGIVFSASLYAANPSEIKIPEGLDLKRLAVSLNESKNVDTFTDFLFSDPQTLLWVKDGALHIMVPGSKPKDSIALPKKCRRIAVELNLSGAATGLFVYGTANPKDDAVWSYQGQGKFNQILKTGREISALTSANGRLFFATGNKLYQFTPSEGISFVWGSALVGKIRSMAFEPQAEILYLASETHVYALRAGTADVILEGLSGNLESPAGDLIIYTKPDEAYLLTGLPAMLVMRK